MRILLADSDSELAAGLTQSLRRSGHVTDCVTNGTQADSALATQDFDLLILDFGLRKMSWLEVLRRLRLRNSSLPVLVLAAEDSVEHRVMGLDFGADDFMAKPFALSELEARVRALARRGAGAVPQVITHGPLTYDRAGRTACINDRTIALSARELGLLDLLLQRPGCLFSKRRLASHLCELGEVIGNNAVEVYVHRLRKKIERDGVRIAHVRGIGYCLEKIPDAVGFA